MLFGASAPLRFHHCKKKLFQMKNLPSGYVVKCPSPDCYFWFESTVQSSKHSLLDTKHYDGINHQMVLV